jgi:hypothetical protein
MLTLLTMYEYFIFRLDIQNKTNAAGLPQRAYAVMMMMFPQ